MTSDKPFPSNLTEIDALTRRDHFYLSEDDDCYFLGEYTGGKDYSFSPTNDLVSNFKKTLDKRDTPQWSHKEAAIRQVSKALRKALDDDWRENAVFVPVPPSKTKEDPLYDDRMVQTLRGIDRQNPVQIREIIFQKQSVEAAHTSNKARDLNKIRNLYLVNEELCTPTPETIIICDDVLTTGAHFNVIKGILVDLLPKAHIMGLFIARRTTQ